jgi:hypothetical protein
MGGALATLTGLLTQKPVQTTYSFKDLTGVLVNPLMAAAFPIVGGNIGVGEINIRMDTVRTEHEVAADGVVMPSYIAGNNATVTLQMQQTSELHHSLLALYNSLVVAADGGDISNWAATVLSLRTILDGSGHFLSGVSFEKIPDKPYAARGQMVTWTLKAASCINQ